MRCAKVALGEVQRVTKDQSPLCIGVGDLHALPVQRGHHVAWSRSVARRHILNAGRNGVNDATGIKLRHRGGRLDHRNGTVLIHLHLFHAVGRLNGDAARVEADALPHHRESATEWILAPRRAAREDHHARRII